MKVEVTKPRVNGFSNQRIRPGVSPKAKMTVGCVGATDRSNGPEEEVRPRSVSAELHGNPEDACSRDQSQKGQARQFAIDTDAAFNRPLTHPQSFAIRDDATSQGSKSHSELKSRARQRRTTQQGLYLLDRHGVAFAPYQQRELVDRNEAGK